MPGLTSLAVLPCLAYIVLYLEPRASVSTNIAVTSPRYVTFSYITTYAAAIVLGYLGFGHTPKLADFVVPVLLLYGEHRNRVCVCTLTNSMCRNVSQTESAFTGSWFLLQVDKSAGSSLLEGYPIESGITQDILFLDAEHVLHARPDVVWHLDQQSRPHL